MAGGGAGDDVAADLLAERVLGDRDLAVGPREHVVLGLLDAEQPLPVVADRADQPTRVLALGIDAARVGEDPDPVEPELLDAIRGDDVDLLCHVLEAALRRQRVEDVALGHVEHGGQLLRLLRRVLDLIRRREDRRRLLGDCEGVAAAVEDRATDPRHLDGRDLLAAGVGAVLAALDGLQPAGADHDDAEGEREGREEEADPLLDQSHRASSRESSRRSESPGSSSPPPGRPAGSSRSSPDRQLPRWGRSARWRGRSSSPDR